MSSSRFISTLWATAALLGSALAQEREAGLLPLEERSDGELVMEAFEESIEATRASQLGIYAPPREFIGLATVVSADGLLLAKASEIVTIDQGISELQVRNARYRSGSLELLALDLDNDLVLLRTDLEGVEPVRWAEAEPMIGDWTFSFINRLRSAVSGVISANSRELSSTGAFLGVVLRADPEQNGKPLVTELSPGSAADVGGVLVGDYIVGIDGERLEDVETLGEEIRLFIPGVVVALMIERGGLMYQTDVELGYRSSLERTQSSNAVIAGQVSERQNGFGRIYQHTGLLSPEMMGGALFNLDGECLGINIARLDRTATFTLPPEQVMLSLQRMEVQSGEAVALREVLEPIWRPVHERLLAEAAATEAEAVARAEVETKQVEATPAAEEAHAVEEPARSEESEAGEAPELSAGEDLAEEPNEPENAQSSDGEATERPRLAPTDEAEAQH